MRSRCLLYSFVSASVYKDHFHQPKYSIKKSVSIPSNAEVIEIDGFKCFIPLIDSKTSNRNEPIPTNQPDLELASSIINAAPCLDLTTEDWIYELCPKTLTQKFNLDDVESLIEDVTPLEVEYLQKVVYSLGSPTESIRNFQQSEKHIFTQLRTKGTFCEDVGAYRTASVYYSCGDEMKVVDVVEYSVCKYTIYVSIPDLCRVEFSVSNVETVDGEIVCQRAGEGDADLFPYKAIS